MYKNKHLDTAEIWMFISIQPYVLSKIMTVDAKFSSTLPKDSAVSDSLDKNKYLDTAEIWSY